MRFASECAAAVAAERERKSERVGLFSAWSHWSSTECVSACSHVWKYNCFDTRSTRLHSARSPPLEIRCFIYFSFYYIYFFFPFFTPLQFFSLHLFLLSPDETARKNNCGIYTLAESKKTIIINYLEKKKKKKEKKCEGGPFSPGRLARLPCGCDKTNRALWVLGLMEFRTSGSSFFFPFFVSCRGRLGF